MKAIRSRLFRHRFVLGGLNLERFLNTVHKVGIPLLSVSRRDARSLVCECCTADLSSLSALAQEKGWRMTELQPLGLSGIAAGLLHRPGIPAGCLLMLTLVLMLSQFIWRVEINGAGAYRADIAAYLSETGYSYGRRRSAIDAQALERSLTYRYPDIAWFHVYASGVTLVVDVTPGVTVPELSSADFGNIIAQHGGIVDSIRVFSGTACVQAGDVVQKGQVLIQGTERAADGQFTPVQAEGVVMARCWRSHTVRMPVYEIHSEETGRETVQHSIATPWFRWPKHPEAPDYLAWNTYLKTHPVVGSFFPVTLETTTQREVSMEYAARPLSQVKSEAGQAALQALKTALFGYEIIDKWVDYCMIESDTLAATATAEWLMDIGGTEPP